MHCYHIRLRTTSNFLPFNHLQANHLTFKPTRLTDQPACLTYQPNQPDRLLLVRSRFSKFATESRMTMTTFTAIVVFTCTWLFAGVNSTSCSEVLHCMNKGSPDLSCSGYDAFFTCVSALPANCGVDESQVTFKALLQPAKDFCNAFTPHLNESNSCPSYGACLLQHTVGQIVNASSQPQDQTLEKLFGLLLKSSTFCGLMEDTATCVITETQAGRCSFSNEFVNTMKQAKQNVTDVCNGKVSATGGNLWIHASLILTGAAIASFIK